MLCLNYHRVGDSSRDGFDESVWSADAETFDRQVRFLKSSVDVVTPRDLPDILRRRKGRSALITFDDGYVDNFREAFPILRSHRVPATFFVATGFLDDPHVSWWDEIAWMARTSRTRGLEASPWLPAPLVFDEPNRAEAVRTLLKVYKEMQADATAAYLDFLADATGSGRYGPPRAGEIWMTWDMLREMRAAGMVIGGHTVNHHVLTRLPAERQFDEIAGCGRRLAEELGEPMRYFSYPVGKRYAFDATTRECLPRAGVQYAFSYYGGMRGFRNWDDFDIRRIPIERKMEPDWFRALVRLPTVFGRGV